MIQTLRFKNKYFEFFDKIYLDSTSVYYYKYEFIMKFEHKFFNNRMCNFKIFQTNNFKIFRTSQDITQLITISHIKKKIAPAYITLNIAINS